MTPSARSISRPKSPQNRWAMCRLPPVPGNLSLLARRSDAFGEVLSQRRARGGGGGSGGDPCNGGGIPSSSYLLHQAGLTTLPNTQTSVFAVGGEGEMDLKRNGNQESGRASGCCPQLTSSSTSTASTMLQTGGRSAKRGCQPCPTPRRGSRWKTTRTSSPLSSGRERARAGAHRVQNHTRTH